MADLVRSVREQNLEGLVAKRRDSIYEPGQRSGAWRKMRVNQGQEFVIGGYTRSPKNFDALVFGYYDGDRLLYAAHPQRVYTSITRGPLPAFEKAAGTNVSLRQPAGKKSRALGTGPDSGQNGGVSVGEA
jgi:ATP-dependent DNA ligase